MAPATLPCLRLLKMSSKRTQGSTAAEGPSSWRTACWLKAPSSPWKATAGERLGSGFFMEWLLASGEWRHRAARADPARGPGYDPPGPSQSADGDRSREWAAR